LRINPHVDAHTHRYITTGTHENKFGIDWTQAEAAFAEAARLPGIALLGIHSHIGSQITAPGPFGAAIARIDGLLDRLERRGIRLAYRNIGGGLGISYRPGQRRLDVDALARLLSPSLRRRPMRVIIEPGRFLVGEAGAIVARVIFVKRGIRKNFVIVDAAMNDLARPILYDAPHPITSVSHNKRVPATSRTRVDVVGPVLRHAEMAEYKQAHERCIQWLCEGWGIRPPPWPDEIKAVDYSILGAERAIRPVPIDGQVGSAEDLSPWPGLDLVVDGPRAARDTWISAFHTLRGALK
jgi:diaminopimelate decarboxylase